MIGNLRNQKGQRVPTPLTPDEQYTHVTLWALLAAPLIFSGDIANMDDFTLSLLTNSELIDINGIEGKCRIRNIWIQKDLPDLEGEMMFEINPHGCMALRVWKRE